MSHPNLANQLRLGGKLLYFLLVGGLFVVSGVSASFGEASAQTYTGQGPAPITGSLGVRLPPTNPVGGAMTRAWEALFPLSPRWP
jgi:hypothetical protein